MELQTQEVEFEDVPPGLHAIAVQGLNGDTKHIWNPKNEIETEAAKVLFDKLVSEGYLAFRLSRINRRGKPMTDFAPKAGRAVFVAPRTEKAAEERKAAARDDTDGEQMDGFDQGASDVVMVPQRRGG